MLLKTVASHPVRHDGANPTRAGYRYALDREIPLLAFVGRIPRTGFAGCYGRPLRVAFLQTSCLRLKRLDGGSPTALVSVFDRRLKGFFSHSFFAFQGYYPDKSSSLLHRSETEARTDSSSFGMRLHRRCISEARSG